MSPDLSNLPRGEKIAATGEPGTETSNVVHQISASQPDTGRASVRILRQHFYRERAYVFLSRSLAYSVAWQLACVHQAAPRYTRALRSFMRNAALEAVRFARLAAVKEASA